ncbi:MAG: hypothetical protein P8K08_17780 [Fuerstiella sp.]|nr:hypothetical protein [Fuerstiella sp.]
MKICCDRHTFNGDYCVGGVGWQYLPTRPAKCRVYGAHLSADVAKASCDAGQSGGAVVEPGSTDPSCTDKSAGKHLSRQF